MNIIEQLEKVIQNLSDEELSLMIPKASLKLDPNVIQTANFAFWLCFMAELDHSSILEEAWNASKKVYGNSEEVIDLIKQKFGIKVEKIDPNEPGYNANNITFGDKIYVLELMIGKNDSVKLLWKLKNIRDNLSHGRINQLDYDDQNLQLRITKEKILKDYFTYGLNFNLDKSPVWKQLVEEDKKDINNKLKQLKNQK